MDDRQTMWAYCAMKPDDRVAMLALADLLEAGGEDALAFAVRWCERRGKRPRKTVIGDPRKTVIGDWAWDRGVHRESEKANALPWIVFTAAFNLVSASPYYKTYEAAFAALVEPLARGRANFA